ncbi:glycosyltransferase [Flavobacterium paronense]|uniref:Glycosyltransferase family 2 protein n=1 Tax=Flavobacterium paronense TaxID=1392775 RepID=A0ABV5GAQ9_9FLAO|nr:glycosyltransferase [Flavobacterium paronense]MDN3676704.1 glycosyltransferase [Flavobacterium paronense]
MKQQPTVSVCMITYGHEKFIAEAINSVLMQECDFDVELIIANDCSPDQTDQVIQNSIANHPKASWIRYFKHDKNLGMMSNFIFALQQCKGDYIALCEGDDYWTDSSKLQKQVDFLKANLDYVIHSAAAQILNKNKFANEYIGLDTLSKSFTVENFHKKNHLVTCTVMFRNCVKNFPNDFYDITFGDWYLYVLLLKETNLKAYRSTEIFSIYRMHSNGFMNSLSLINKYELHIKQIVYIKKILQYKGFSSDVAKVLNWYSSEKFRIELENKSYFSSIKTFLYNLYLIKFNIAFRPYLGTIKKLIFVK